MSPTEPRRLLVLGGTNFLGRALVESALGGGHSVTLFNRGMTNPELFGRRVEKVRGDRSESLAPLAGRGFDAVVDVAAYHPAVVERSLAALGELVDRYLFVSTISVYADQRRPPTESSPVLELTDPTDESDASYGARKAACERLVLDRLGEAATIVRPGLIVGPQDPTDRFSYWPRRLCEGGKVLAPGDPSDPLQFIDVRDLAEFILRLVVEDVAGIFNATGHTIAFGDFLASCQEVCQSDAEVVWVASERLLAAGLDPWMGIPLWISDPEWASANRVDITRALRAGLSFRPLVETIRAALEPRPDRKLSQFGREEEAALLEKLAPS